MVAGLAGWMVATRSQTKGPNDVAWLSMTFFEGRAGSLFGARFLAISDDGCVSRSCLRTVCGFAAWTRPLRCPSMSLGRIRSLRLTATGSPSSKMPGQHRGLVKVPASGGVPVPIVPTSDRPGGGTWRSDGTIVYATSVGPLRGLRQRRRGALLAKPDAAKKHRQFAWPRFMPGGRSVLFTILTDTIDAASIARLDLEDG